MLVSIYRDDTSLKFLLFPRQAKGKRPQVIFSFSMLFVLNLSGRLDGQSNESNWFSFLDKLDMRLASLTLFKTKVVYFRESNEYLGSEESKLSNYKFIF